MTGAGSILDENRGVERNPGFCFHVSGVEEARPRAEGAPVSGLRHEASIFSTFRAFSRRIFFRTSSLKGAASKSRSQRSGVRSG